MFSFVLISLFDLVTTRCLVVAGNDCSTVYRAQLHPVAGLERKDCANPWPSYNVRNAKESRVSGASSATTVRSTASVAASHSIAPPAATTARTRRVLPVGPTTVAQPVLLSLEIAVV